jgi:hypothetical protein
MRTGAAVDAMRRGLFPREQRNLVQRAVDDVRPIVGLDDGRQPARPVDHQRDEALVLHEAEDVVCGAKEDGNGTGIAHRVVP